MRSVQLFLLILVASYISCEAKKKEKSRSPSPSRSSEPSANVCYDDDDDPYIYFATKTAYHFNRNKEDDEIVHQDCEAKQFWLLARHGTRNPGTEDMQELEKALPLIRKMIVDNHSQGLGSLCVDDIDNLLDWRFRANVTEDKFLVKEGYKELEGLGDRFQDRFPGLLTKTFTNESYVFRFTDSERTEASAKAFARGVFGKKEAPNVWYQKPQNPDTLLRFYKKCQKWKKEVDDNPDAIIEKTLYESSAEFSAMVNSVSQRLGFTQSLNLTAIDTMYTMCSFDKAWRPKKLSPWCAVFSEEDLQVLEYREDLEYYYEDGYGFQINYEQACPPVKDILDNFKQVVDKVSSRPKGIFYFTHSGTLLKVMARLGLFRDREAPKHNNRNSKQMNERQWRTSLIDSFATNVALTLFQCSDGLKVAGYVQERAVRFPGCSSHLCPYNQFVQQFADIANSCNLDEICSI